MARRQSISGVIRVHEIQSHGAGKHSGCGRQCIQLPEKCQYTGMQAWKCRPTETCNNMILAAPSGSGKTETYRAFKDYFKKRIPALRLTISDVSNLTATGYRGAEPSSIVEPFLGCGLEPIGIVFMDEFDKICTPSYNANHGDVHLEVQHNLLTLVEGSRVETKQGYVNTNKLLFIGMGSFDQFRKREK